MAAVGKSGNVRKISVMRRGSNFDTDFDTRSDYISDDDDSSDHIKPEILLRILGLIIICKKIYMFI